MSEWTADRTSAEGLAPIAGGQAPSCRSIEAKAEKQTQDIPTKNPCDYRKAPKHTRTRINALSRSNRMRMLQLACNASVQPLTVTYLFR